MLLPNGVNDFAQLLCASGKTGDFQHDDGITRLCLGEHLGLLALDLGITTVKFFPANVYGGLKALKALSAPFPQIKFIPTGGVDRGNIDEFLAFDKVAAIGGSFFVKESLEKLEENNG